MWSVIWQWLADNYPMIFGVAAACAFVALITWKIASWRNETKEISKKIDQKPNKSELPCDTHKQRFDEHKGVMNEIKEDIGSVHTAISSIQNDLTELKTYLMVNNPQAALIFSGKHSPRQLNELGKKIYADVQGEEFLNENLGMFFSAIDELKPQTALDVETFALSILIENMNSPIFNRLKMWVYNSPAIKLPPLKEGDDVREYAIVMSDICFILSIPLRDKYLTQHSELNN